MHLQRGLGIDFLRGDGICLNRILHLDIADAVGLRSVCIDRGGVLDAFVKEVQRELQITSVLIGDSTDEPVTLLACLLHLGLTGDHDVVSRLGQQVPALFPVNGHILDELERVHVLLVVLGNISGHLQWRVHRHIQG